MEQETATPPLLTPPTGAPPGTLALFAGKETGHTSLEKRGRHLKKTLGVDPYVLPFRNERN
jgi:hypothetical protein